MKDTEHYQGWWKREVVLYRGDNIVAQGTIRQVAEQLNVQKRTVYWLTMPTAHRRADARKDQNKAMRAIVV